MSISKEELKELIRSTIRENQPQAAAPEQPVESHVDHVVGCKNCYPAVIKKARETFSHQCSDCGLALSDAMVGPGTPPCPNCGSTMPPKEIKRK
jgi:DNA-directed RNA polymerase subunit RPC12/RpoP